MHLNWCVFKCILSLHLYKNIFSHTPHLNWCILKCIYSLHLCEDIFSHTAQGVFGVFLWAGSANFDSASICGHLWRYLLKYFKLLINRINLIYSYYIVTDFRVFNCYFATLEVHFNSIEMYKVLYFGCRLFCW